MKKLVTTPLTNTIWWATVNEKNGTMNTSTRVDVTDNLGHILQLGFDEGQLFLIIGGAVNGGSHDDAFIEGGGGFCHRHGAVVI